MIIVAYENKIYIGTIIETITQETLFNDKIIVSYRVNIGDRILDCTPEQIYKIENKEFLCK